MCSNTGVYFSNMHWQAITFAATNLALHRSYELNIISNLSFQQIITTD